MYFTTAIALSIIPGTSNPRLCKPFQTIYISTNGVHLDIIAPKVALSPELTKHLSVDFQGAYISFGWGDEDFYLNTPTWNDLTFKTAINAMLLPSPTAMHVTFYKQKKSHWKKVTVCENQMEILNQYLFQSFHMNIEKRFQIIKSPGYSHNDAFYKATGNYSCIITCNEWVNSALKEMDIKTSIWSPFDFGVLYHLD